MFNATDNIDNNVSQLTTSIGIVVDNEDPLQLCRIRCKVQGLLEPKDIKMLPWCRPMSKGTSCRNDYGKFQVPELYSKVKIHFPNGDIRNPEYTALGDEATDSSQTRLFGENYPSTEGECDASGNWTRTNKKEQYKENLHSSGTYTKIDKEGNVHVFIPKNLIIHIGENLHIKADKDIVLHTLTSLGLIASEKIGIKSSDSTEILASKITIEAEGGIDLNSGITFGTADSLKSSIESNITTVDERQKKVVSLQKQILKVGKSTAEGLKSTSESLTGTKSS